jgi:hypothetical protein
MSTVIDAIIERAEAGTATLKDGCVILAEMQKELDHLAALIDCPPVYDQRVIIRVDDNEKLFRFSSIDKLADWIVGGWDGNN